MENKNESPITALTMQTSDKSTSLSFYDRFADPLESINKLGAMISTCRMFGNLNEQQGKVIAWHLLVKKKDPFDLKREYHILSDGNITKRADAMMADFIRRGGKVEMISDLMDKTEAKAKFTKDGSSYTWSFKMDDAAGFNGSKNGGLKDNWRNNPADMLRARLFSKAIRILDPEINQGVYTPEEILCGDDKSDTDSPPQPRELFTRKQEGQTDTTAEIPLTQTSPEPVTSKEPKHTEAVVVNSTPLKQEIPQSRKVENAKTLPEDKKPPELQFGSQVPPPPTDVRVIAAQKLKDVPVEKTNLFLMAKKWIKEGESILDLSDQNAKALLENIAGTVILINSYWESEQKRKDRVLNGGVK